MPPDRWFGIGSCEGAQERAGARAVDDALMHDDPKLLIVFCSPAHDLRQLLREIRDRAGDLPLIGCTTAGEIATAGPSDASVVTAMGGSGFAVRTTVATEASRNLREAGARVARSLPDRGDLPHKVVLLLSDGLAGDQQEIVRGRRVGEPMLVTSSAGNRAYALDDRPALDVYLKHLGVTEPAHPDQERLARLALIHPFGLSRSTGEDEVRFIGGADFAERSLSCIAEVPRGALVWIMEGDARSVLEATDAACGNSPGALGGRPPLGMIAFDCIARRAVLGFHNQTLVVLSIG